MTESKASSKIRLLESDCLQIISSRHLLAKQLAKKCSIRSYTWRCHQALSHPLLGAGMKRVVHAWSFSGVLLAVHVPLKIKENGAGLGRMRCGDTASELEWLSLSVDLALLTPGT